MNPSDLTPLDVPGKKSSKKKNKRNKGRKVAPVSPSVVMNHYETIHPMGDRPATNAYETLNNTGASSTNQYKTYGQKRGVTNAYEVTNHDQGLKSGLSKGEDIEMDHMEKAADVVETLWNVKKAVNRFKRCGRRVVAEGTAASKKMHLVRGIDSSISGDPLNPNRTNAELIGYFGQLAVSKDQNATIDLEYLDLLLRRGANVNSTDKYGQTALHEIARMWDTDVAVFMIERGGNVNQPDEYGRTPLHIAAAVDYAEMINVLIENGAKIEALTKEEKQTPLFYAARNDACNALRLLLKKNAELHQRDYKGRTPLIVAAELDRSETSRLLLEMGANASDVDRSGHSALQIMVTKMPAVAKEGLNNLYRCDRANRKQYYDLHLLEPIPKNDSIEVPSRTVLQSIVHYRQQELIMHPVCRELVSVKWTKFGWKGATKQLLFNLLFILTWTVLAVSLDTPFQYSFPVDAWRLGLEIFGVLLTFFQIFQEVKEYRGSKKTFIAWRDWRKTELERDLAYCHPQWPQEREYLLSEIEEIKDQAPTYFSDKWNLFDWGVYIALLIVTFLHVIDIFLDANGLSVATQNIFALVIIFVWLRLMKSMRAYKFIGPFIVMLAEIAKDFAIFVYIYANFFIPYACAFWMTYGTQVPSMMTVDRLVYSLFRITLVDEYEYDEMRAVNVWMTYVLLVTFLMISAILCINVLIAMLSNTFQRVYDNATAIALMQQTKIILNIEDGLGKKKIHKYHKFIHAECSPRALYYDDDMTEEGGDDLKKMTFQIKDALAELDEFVREEQHKSHSTNMTDLREELNQYKQSQEKELRNINSDLKVIQELLRVVIDKSGRLPSPSPTRPAGPTPGPTPINGGRGPSPIPRPIVITPAPEPRPDEDDDMRHKTLREEKRASRREREERERYLQFLLNKSLPQTEIGGGTDGKNPAPAKTDIPDGDETIPRVVQPVIRGGSGVVDGAKVIYGTLDMDYFNSDRDVEAPADSLAERIRIKTTPTTKVHHEKELQKTSSSSSSDEE